MLSRVDLDTSRQWQVGEFETTRYVTSKVAKSCQKKLPRIYDYETIMGGGICRVGVMSTSTVMEVRGGGCLVGNMSALTPCVLVVIITTGDHERYCCFL